MSHQHERGQGNTHHEEFTPRLEDPKLLMGRGQFVADLRFPNELHMAVFRSQYAHARIRHISVDEALRQPGIVAAFTAADLHGTSALPATETPQPVFAAALHLELQDSGVGLLASDAVRYVGQPVAVVLADSRAAAEDGLELVHLDVDPLPAITGEDALTAPELYPSVPGNVLLKVSFERGDSPNPSTAHHVVRARFKVARQGAIPMETRGVAATPDAETGRVTVWTSTQVPHRVRRALASILGWEESRLRIITPDVGGGFGTKANVYAEDALVAYCAARLGRPVRWIEDRTEHLLSAAQSRDQIHDVELTVDAEGRIVSFEDDFLVDLGAYSTRAVGIIGNSAVHAFGPYRMPHIRVSAKGFVSNKPPSAQYRGAGRPEICFALERALDVAARALGIDGFEIRRRNLIRAEEMPYPQGVPQRDGVPIVYDASDYLRVFQQAIELADPESWTELRSEAERAGERFGTGCATYVEATGRGPSEGARVRLDRDGQVHIFTGATSTGQGHATTLAKVCSRVLGVPLEAIKLTGGDTDLMPNGVGTFASRTAVVAGNAVHQASMEVRQQLIAVASDRLHCPPSLIEWNEGAARGPAGDLLPLSEILSTAGAPDHFESEVHFHPDTVTWTMGAHVAAVAVDPDTGRIRILRYASVHDGGPSLDETIVEGQMQGGITQGIGGALLEELAFGSDGQPQTITLADYLIPTSMEVPDIKLGHFFAPSSNPLGIKGVGESGTVPAGAALANAVSNALDGAELNSLPLKPEVVWAAAQRS